jgi:hypothetical protein
MKPLIRLTLALAAGTIAPSAFADTSSPLPAQAVAAHEAAVAAQRIQHVRAAQPSARGDSQPKTMGTQPYPGTPGVNLFRAYPPSCAADPLPNHASGPAGSVHTARVPLYVNNSTLENVTVTVWRIACSSSGSHPPYNPAGNFNAMTLVRIDRDNDSNTTSLPRFPLVTASQGSIGFNTTASLVRLAAEPNTVVSEIPFDAPFPLSTTFALENYPYTASGYFTFSDAFTIRFDPYLPGIVNPVDIAVEDYNPTAATYPDAFNPLPLDGYAAAQWVNVPLNEGLLVQVTEQGQANGTTQRQLVFDLLTQDLNHNPLWLVGNAPFAVGATSIEMDAIYLGANLTHLPWGKAKFVLQDCGHIDVTFTPNAGLPAPIPSFAGTTTYGRLFDANGMVCE